MFDDAKNAYEELLRLIEEEEACAVESAHLSAMLKRNDARRSLIQSQQKAALASMKKSVRAKEIGQLAQGSLSTPAINITTNVNTAPTNAPTYNQMGDGGQYIAEKMFL